MTRETYLPRLRDYASYDQFDTQYNLLHNKLQILLLLNLNFVITS